MADADVLQWDAARRQWVRGGVINHGKTGWAIDISNDITLSFDNGTRTLTVTGAEDYFIGDVRYTVSSPDTVTITDTEGLWYIYYSGATLTASQTLWNIRDNDIAFVTMVYWDATRSTANYVQWEMHSWLYSAAVHDELHSTLRTLFASGFGMTDNADGTLDLSIGTMFDEDIEITTIDGAGAGMWEQPHTPIEAPVLYLSGAGADVRSDFNGVSSTYICLQDGGSNPYWNEFTGGAWQNTPADNNKYMAMWLIATSSLLYPLMWVMGQVEPTVKLIDAVNNNPIDSIAWSNLPFEEIKVIWRVIVRNAGAPYTVSQIDDFRTVTGVAVSGGITNSHASLPDLPTSGHPADIISVDGTAFSDILSATDVDVQTALETLDVHGHPDSDISDWTVADGRYDVLGAAATAESNANTYTDGVVANYLPLAGGTMGGAINMGGNAIDNIPAGAATGDAVEYDQFIAGLAAQDEISELADVALSAIGNNEILQWDDPAGKWENRTLAAADIATATALNPLIDNSMADALHRHSELSASDGTPDRALVVDAAGKVGIGTASPQRLLHLDGGANSYARFDTNVSGKSNWVIGADLYGFIIFEEGGGGYRFVVKEGGRVGIGTQIPAELLDVAGNVKIAGALSGATTIDASGELTTGGTIRVDRGGDAADANIQIIGDAGESRHLGYYTLDGTNKLRFRASVVSTAESGANAGSDYYIYRYADNGGFLGVSLKIIRSTGNVTLEAALAIGGALSGVTTIDANGDITITKTTANPYFIVNANAGQLRGFRMKTAGSMRWLIGANVVAESGSNVGSNLDFYRYDDAGNYLGAALSISRATGLVTLEGALVIGGTLSGLTDGSATGEAVEYDQYIAGLATKITTHDVWVAAYLTNDQNLNAGGVAQITLDAETFDVGNDFNTGTYDFVAPAAMKVWVTASVMFTPRGDTWNAGDYMKVYLAKNDGTVHESYATAPNSGASEKITVQCSALVDLAEADTVQLYARCEIDAIAEGTATRTYLHIAKAA